MEITSKTFADSLTQNRSILALDGSPSGITSNRFHKVFPLMGKAFPINGTSVSHRWDRLTLHVAIEVVTLSVGLKLRFPAEIVLTEQGCDASSHYLQRNKKNLPKASISDIICPVFMLKPSHLTPALT